MTGEPNNIVRCWRTCMRQAVGWEMEPHGQLNAFWPCQGLQRLLGDKRQ